MELLITGSLLQGLIFGIMAIGVYLTFRILNYPDLTVDGSYPLGGAVAATLIVKGVDPFLSTLFAALAGALGGSITGLLHTKLKINGLLAGILTMIGLYSINLRIMGKANMGLLNEKTIISTIQENRFITMLPEDFHIYVLLVIMLLFVLIIKFLIDWFLRTDLGMAIRATGDNPKMISSFGANTDTTKMIGLILSNGLVGLAGGIMAQYQGFADVQMGVGMIVIGLASVIIGEVVFGSRTIQRTTFSVIGGAILYRFVIAFALYIGLKTTDMKLITAIIVIIALSVPQLVESARNGKKNKSTKMGGLTDAINRSGK